MTIKEDFIFVADTAYIGRGGYDPHRPLTTQTVLHTIKHYARAAGLDEKLCNIHMWRHLSARTRFEEGEDLRSIQKLLRHSSLSVTDIYIREMTTVSDQGAQLLSARFGNL